MGQPAGSDRMGIFPGQERSARRRAHGHSGVLIEAQAFLGHAVNVGRLDFRAVTAHLGKTQIVHQNDQHVGRIRRGFDGLLPEWLAL